MANFILSIDQGTTSSRAIIFSDRGAIVSVAQEEFPQHFPKDGWVEHDPNDIWNTVLSTCKKAIATAEIQPDHIAAIGITNQRETTLIWDRATGQPIYNAIVWQDRRTSAYCDELKTAGHEADITAKTGLLIDPYFSATKIQWILDHVAGARERAENGELAFGTVDSFILWKLTQGASHKTDATNASRTLVFNIHDQTWDESLLNLFRIPIKLMPQVLDSSDNFGICDPAFLGAAIPVYGIAGDQQAALFGQTCFKEGMAKSTYGTGCFLMLNTGTKALASHNRLLTTVAYRLNGETTYALEGSIFAAGTTIQWLRDGLKLIDNASETEALAEDTPLHSGVYMVPAFTGLGAPYWDPNARGAIFGLTRDTGIKEIVTAGLQAVCYQTKDLQKAMENDGVRPSAIRVDGGMVANNWLLQFLADILNATVDRPKIIETTALGVAYLAGLKAGIFADLEALEQLWERDSTYKARITDDNRNTLYSGWQDAVKRVQ